MAALGLDSCNKNHQPFFHQNRVISHSHSASTFSKRRMDDQYEQLNVISHGSYGVVYKARDKKTGEIVAMKKEIHGLSRSTLREIQILESLPRHPSIVEFKQVIMDERDRVFVVMEFMDTDLKRFMGVKKKPFKLNEIKFIMKQILQGVGFLHENGVMHRDLKPSNILVNKKGRLKICDFGFSRHMKSASGRYNCRVGTLWYRAPELILGAKTYSSAIDMWSVGCIMAELVLKQVLFRGESDAQQLGCIRQFIGTPRNVLHLKLCVAASFTGGPLLSVYGYDLLERLLAYDPEKRITAKDALNHSWFKECY